MSKIIRNLRLIFLPSQENNFKARLLRGDFLFRIVLAFFVLRIIVLPLYVRFPKSIFFAEITCSEIFDLLNEQRMSQGLNTLKEDPKLSQAAFLKAQDMFEHNYFGHKSPSGTPGWHWIKQAAYDYEIAGENLAIGFLDSGEVHQAWNESTLHQGNLLSPYFQDIGVAVLTGEFQGKETTIVVQLFGKSEAPVAEKVIPPVVTEIEEITEEIPPEEIPPEEEPLPITEEQVLPEEIPEEKIPEEIAPGLVVAPEVISGKTPEKSEPSFQSKSWEFLTQKYSGLIQKVIFVIVFLITLIFILNVIAIIGLALPLKKRRLLLRQLVPAVSLTIIFLILLGFLDKTIIIQLVPHHLEI